MQRIVLFHAGHNFLITMNIDLHQIEQARQRRGSRDRQASARSNASAVAAFRAHQRNGNNQLPTAPTPAAAQQAAQLPPPSAGASAAGQLPPLPPAPQLPALEHPPQNEDFHGGSGSDDDDSVSVRAAMRAIDSPYGSAIDNDINQYGANEDRYGTDYSFETGGGELDYAAEDFSINDRVMHYLAGNLICKSTRLAVEIAGAIYALGVVTSEETTNVSDRNEKLLRVYREYLNAFDPACFEPGLKDKMLNKLYNAQQNLTGARLWTKSNEWRGELRNGYMPKLPMNLATLPSGTGLRDAYDKFIFDRYKEANVSICCKS